MLKMIAIAVVVLLVGVLVLAAMKPDVFRVQRTTVIKAPPEKLFALLEDFNNWSAWSPYEKFDPDMKRTISGAAKGKGAVYEWEGKGKAGAGRMEILDSTPHSKITIKLDFTKPFEAHNTAEFSFEPEGDATRVTWAMHGPNRFIAKIMQVFSDMDRMIGKDFETGLANLKAIAEK